MTGTAKAFLRRSSFPLFQGILPLHKARIAPDIIAGITLAALGIPEVMGYTRIIGTPVVTGLYTMLLPMLAFALFGSSRYLVVSADSATAAMVAAALTTMAFVANTPQYVALCSLVALEGAVLLLALARAYSADPEEPAQPRYFRSWVYSGHPARAVKVSV